MPKPRNAEARSFYLTAVPALGLSLLAILVLSLSLSSPTWAGGTNAGAAKTSVTGRPLPRFVSLKADKVNLRGGPGRDYPILWVFRRAGLPVEIINEFQGWRQVRDSEGTQGWVSQGLLSRRRTALIAPWNEPKDGQPAGESIIESIHYSDSTSSRPVAKVEPGVIADLFDCDGAWCRVGVGAYQGYVSQKKLWGVYENETLR